MFYIFNSRRKTFEKLKKHELKKESFNNNNNNNKRLFYISFLC